MQQILKHECANLILSRYDSYVATLNKEERIQSSSDSESASVKGRIISGSGESAIVLTEHGEGLLLIPGKLMYENIGTTPVTGDWVRVIPLEGEEKAVLEQILPRKSSLSRKSPGREGESVLLSANIDLLVIVTGMDDDFSINRIRRYLVLAASGGIKPLILLNKLDLAFSPEKMISDIRLEFPGTDMIAISALDPDGIKQLKAKLQTGDTTAMIGSSGAGKSTIINALNPGINIETREVRASDSKGKHTTVRRELYCTEDGFVLMDQPGLREVGITDDPDAISEVFSDIEELSAQCRFHDCRHEKEPGCAVIKAVEDGVLSEKRFNEYHKFIRESQFYRNAKDTKERLKHISKDIKQFQKHRDKRR